MAECVQFVGQGVPIRLTDDEAFQIVVRDGDGWWCSKTVWREWHARSNGTLDMCSRDLRELQAQRQRKRRT